MSEPEVVRIKRKRSEPAPETLLVQYARAHKRARETGDFTEGGRYQRRDIAKARSQPSASKGSSSEAQLTQENVDGGLQLPPDPATEDTPRSAVTAQLPPADKAARPTFRLTKSISKHEHVTKRSKKADDVATFQLERKRKLPEVSSPVAAGGAKKRVPLRVPSQTPELQTLADDVVPLRVPGQTPELQALADDLEAWSIRQAPKDPASPVDVELKRPGDGSKTAQPARPPVTAMPKLPSHRSKELHQERMAAMMADAQSRGDEMDIDTDEDVDYVYDTYILTHSSNAAGTQVEMHDQSASIGYLIITEADEAAWEKYIDDDPSDDDVKSDEEDENAEGWYGADYPEDELASDDEFNRNAYTYRDRGASDDEEWEADAGTWSDEEDERQMNPWRKAAGPVARQFAKYLQGDGDDDNE